MEKTFHGMLGGRRVEDSERGGGEGGREERGEEGKEREITKEELIK